MVIVSVACTTLLMYLFCVRMDNVLAVGEKALSDLMMSRGVCSCPGRCTRRPHRPPPHRKTDTCGRDGTTTTTTIGNLVRRYIPSVIKNMNIYKRIEKRKRGFILLTVFFLFLWSVCILSFVKIHTDLSIFYIFFIAPLRFCLFCFLLGTPSN